MIFQENHIGVSQTSKVNCVQQLSRLTEDLQINITAHTEPLNF